MSGSNSPQQPLPSQHGSQQLLLPRAHQPGGGAPGSSKAVTFEEVSRFFTLPIAEAATSLGVCTSVLKRICRNNGIARWPYRQFLAGKTMEDIQKEAAREKSKELSELAKVTKPVMSPSTVVQPNSGSQLQVRSISHALSLERSKLAGPAPHLQMNKSQTERNNTNVVLQSPHSRSIPNFFDEFKYGFPSNGLSYVSNKWWGTGNEEVGDTSRNKGEENKSPNKESICADYNSSHMVSQPVSRLVSSRRRQVKDGHESIRLSVLRGYNPYMLNARERSVLLQVFHALPGQWK